MKFLFSTLQYIESDFYGRVGAELERRGHEVVHLTSSRRAADVLRRRGYSVHCLPELMGEVRPLGSWREEESRIVAWYPIAELRDVYRTDPSCREGPHRGDCVERTLREFLAIERLFDRVSPELVVPEVGNENMRTISHLVGVYRGATVLFLLYTMFDRPLRLYANTLDAPIVSHEELRPLSAEEEIELDDFVARYKHRDRPIREHRRAAVTSSRIVAAARHFAVRALWDRDNVYLTPGSWVVRDLRYRARELAAHSLYSEPPLDRPFVYFPLQVADDYKILRLRPHCVDQESLITRLVDALPDGVHVVVKEHPMSIGRNSIHMLRRLVGDGRIRVVDPYASSLELVRRSVGVATISSTVGLEALLYERPVLTLGRPFYAGYGVTLDADGVEGIGDRAAVLLDFRPERERTRRFLHAAMRRCYPGAPVLVDRSDENASVLAETLDRAARGELGDRRYQPTPA
jgi:hypothetical protein